jgi:transcriptional regulator with GAF, ATPase, and Fis domain
MKMMREALAINGQSFYPSDDAPGAAAPDGIVGESPALRRVLRLVETVATTDAAILIRGETGTGKELIAGLIHRLSDRRGAPFVKFNCTAIPAGLLDSELFGHERGAFTGAIARRIGRFELAHDGTLLLDEIGDLPLELQAKLLRAIQEGEIERVGGAKPIKTDFRLIAATNVDLEKAVKDGRFREDLYYRINVIPIKLPPLRDRMEDLPDLARFFLTRYKVRFRKGIQGISDSALKILSSYWWPGNIRELENLVERLVAVSDKEWITDEDLPFEFHFAQLDSGPGRSESLFQEATNTFERNFILRALEKSRGNVTATARYLGIPLSTLKFKMDKLDIRELAKKLRGA